MSRRSRRGAGTFRTRGGVVMQVWHFSEMAYHPAWPELGESYRVIIPSRLYDPKAGADLYHRYLDEWALCDELGINIMTNEHHATRQTPPRRADRAGLGGARPGPQGHAQPRRPL